MCNTQTPYILHASWQLNTNTLINAVVDCGSKGKSESERISNQYQ